MKIHYFKLNDKPFESISNGRKTIELRLFDEKRQAVRIGDVIIFNNSLTAEVVALHKFNSFKELYSSLDLLKCGYDESNIANASYKDMEEYYSEEKIKKYGVIGIEFKIVELWDEYDKKCHKIPNKYLIRGKEIPNREYHIVSEVAVRHCDNSYLIMQRDKKKHFGGMWELTAGGSALFNESALDCAKRELFEETGIDAINLEQIGMFVDDEKHTIYYEFLCVTDVDKNSILLQDGETIDYKWIAFDEIVEKELASKRTIKCLK